MRLIVMLLPVAVFKYGCSRADNRIQSQHTMPKAKRTNGTDKPGDPTRWKKGKKDVEYTVEAILDRPLSAPRAILRSTSSSGKVRLSLIRACGDTPPAW